MPARRPAARICPQPNAGDRASGVPGRAGLKYCPLPRGGHRARPPWVPWSNMPNGQVGRLGSVSHSARLVRGGPPIPLLRAALRGTGVPARRPPPPKGLRTKSEFCSLGLAGVGQGGGPRRAGLAWVLLSVPRWWSAASPPGSGPNKTEILFTWQAKAAQLGRQGFVSYSARLVRGSPPIPLLRAALRGAGVPGCTCCNAPGGFGSLACPVAPASRKMEQANYCAEE